MHVSSLAFALGDNIFRIQWAVCNRHPAGTCRIYLDACARGLLILINQQTAVYRHVARKGLTLLEINRPQFTVVRLERA